jgi:hypothetical protein
MTTTTDTQVHAQPNAPRYSPPSAAWTFWTTFFFGLWGLIPMFVHTSEARSHAQSTSRYVRAFLWGLVPAILLSAGIALAIVTASSR